MFFLLVLRVARVNFVQEGSESKTFPTSDAGSLLDFTLSFAQT